MLKKELEEQLDAANTLIRSQRASIDELKQDIKALKEQQKEFKELKKVREAALGSISAIMAVNCPDVIHPKHIHMMIEDGKEIPENAKPDATYLALSHIEMILNRDYQINHHSLYGRL